MEMKAASFKNCLPTCFHLNSQFSVQTQGDVEWSDSEYLWLVAAQLGSEQSLSEPALEK